MRSSSSVESLEGASAYVGGAAPAQPAAAPNLTEELLIRHPEIVPKMERRGQELSSQVSVPDPHRALSRDNLFRVLTQVRSWCDGPDLDGTEPRRYTKASAERLQILANIAEAQDDCAGKVSVIKVIAEAFRRLDAADLTIWLLHLRPSIKFILDWMQDQTLDWRRPLLDEGFKPKALEAIKERLELVDLLGADVDVARWEDQLEEWRLQGGRDEQRNQAAMIIGNGIRSGLSPVYGRENVLRLAGLGLKTLPEVIVLLAKATRLFFEGNQLKSLPKSLGLFPRVIYLVLDYNKLRTLPEPVKYFTNLTALDFKYNQVREVPEWIDCLKDLRELRMCGNNIKALPKKLGSLPLRVLRIDSYLASSLDSIQFRNREKLYVSLLSRPFGACPLV